MREVTIRDHVFVALLVGSFTLLGWVVYTDYLNVTLEHEREMFKLEQDCKTEGEQ